MRVFVSTKHLATLQWLHEHYPALMSHAEISQHIPRGRVKRDDVVIGTIPVHVMQACKEYMTVEFANRPGDISTASGMDEAGAYLKRFYLFDDEQIQRMVWSVCAYLAEGNPAPTPDQMAKFAEALVEEARS